MEDMFHTKFVNLFLQIKISKRHKIEVHCVLVSGWICEVKTLSVHGCNNSKMQTQDSKYNLASAWE